MADITQSAASPPRRAIGAGSVALVALGFAPLVLAGCAALWAVPWQRGYLLAFPGAALVAWSRVRRASQPAAPGASPAWRYLPVVGLALLAAATFRWSPGLGLCAALVTLAGCVGSCGGWQLLRALAPAFALLLAGLLPWLPWDAALRAGLQGFIVGATDQLLYSLQVPHYLRGDGFELTALTVSREDLFAGLSGLPGLLMVTLAALLLLRRHPVRILLALVAVVLFVVPCETLRVAWGLEACDHTARNFFHSIRADCFTGALWLLCFGLVLSVDQFIGFLTEARQGTADFSPEMPAPAARIPLRQALGLAPRSTGLAGTLAAVAVVLGLVGAVLGWQQLDPLREPRALASALPGTAMFDMPASGGDWQALPASGVIASVAMTGRDQRSWQWQRSQMTVSLGLDGPFSGYADPGPAYAQRGWEVGPATAVVAATNTAPPSVEMALTRAPMLHARLFYGVLDETGRWLEPPHHTAGWVARPGAADPGSTAAHRVQALAVSARPLTTLESDEARRLFDAARLQLAEQLKRQIQRQ
jgi:hypothetical protein